MSISESLQQSVDSSNLSTYSSFTLTETPDSVYTIANREGVSLQEFVKKDVSKALITAEACVSYWSQLLNQALISGSLTDVDGNVIELDSGRTKLFEKRLDQAKEDLQQVNILSAMYANATTRTDMVVNSLMHKALQQNDTRALIYLIDRLEGRPGESQQSVINQDNAYLVYKLLNSLFAEQLEIINIESGTVMCMCSRKCGKTRVAVVAALVKALSEDNQIIIYIGETMELSEQLFNDTVNELISELDLKDAKGHRFNWKNLGNGSRIMIRGLSNTKDPDQIRGPKSGLIIIDEFFHLKSDLLQYLLREVLEPMQALVPNSKMLCIGTPPEIRDGFADRAWDEWQVPKFEWDMFKCPYPKNVTYEQKMDFVLQRAKEKGVGIESSYIQREYFGKRVYDEDLLLYPEVYYYNPRVSIPQINVSRALIGIDYGASDYTAIIGIAWDEEARQGYQFFESKFNLLSIDKSSTLLEVLIDEASRAWDEALQLFPDMSAAEAHQRIWWTADDSGKSFSQELNLQARCRADDSLRLNVASPHKTDKSLMFDKLRQLFRSADLLLIEGSAVEVECKSTVLLRGADGAVFNEVNDKTYHPDLLPALRYAMWDVVGLEAKKDGQ